MLRHKLSALALGAAAAGLAASGLALAAAAGAAVNGPNAAATPRAPLGLCGTVKTAPKIKHVVLIVMENHSYNTIIGSANGDPYVNSLVASCGLATDYHNITHPSLPEYIALTSALDLSKLGPFETDCNPGAGCDTGSASLFSQLGPKGWKAYDESMGAPCNGSLNGEYAPKHNPAVYYTNIPKATCKANDVNLGTLGSSPFLNAFKTETTAPALTVVTPNLIDDMHDGTVTQGDTWLNHWMTKVLATPVYKSGDTAIFVIWDEGEGGSYTTGEKCATSSDVSCHVAAIVVAPSVPTKTRVSTAFTHDSFVRTVEQLFSKPFLNDAASATSMVSAFHL